MLFFDSALDELMANVAKSGLFDKRIDNGIGDNFTAALKTLQQAGITNSPDYWRNLVNEGVDNYLGQLLVNMANRCRDILERIVWAEARGEDEKGQILVVNVIKNRLASPRYPNTLHDVIFAQGAFTPTTRADFNDAQPNSRTISAVNRAINGEDYSQGATYFHSVSGIIAAELEGRQVWHERAVAEGRLVFLFDHGNHRFYREV